MNIKELIKENSRRREALRVDYDPIRGIGAAGERGALQVEGETWMVPVAMLDDQRLLTARTREQVSQLRIAYDFEFWCATAVTVRDKITGLDVKLHLNRPQRRVLVAMERMRLADKPIRLILLKARQWGGSTLVQMYMAWIQMCHRRNWNSLICAHVKDTAAAIRGMYTKVLDAYPQAYWQEDDAPRPAFKPFERSLNVRMIPGRGCKITLASAEKPSSVRGGDYAMAHLSEAAFWPATAKRTPEDFIRAICAGIPLEPCTLVAIESTANGVGNFFHNEWMRCEQGRGDKLPIFVPWYEIDIYTMPVSDPEELWEQLTPYERRLWERPEVTLEHLCWYHYKALEYPTHAQMCAEFPSDPIEAFINTGSGVFSNIDIERLRQGCREPSRMAEVRTDGGIADDPQGRLAIWAEPEPGAGYVAAMDIGGRTAYADYSVVTVMRAGELPEVVAQWRGHIDHDLLARVAVAIAGRYNQALLVVESNTLEQESAADPSMFLLDRIAEEYNNLYFRTPDRPGFHTNRSTKAAMIFGMVEAVRDGLYVERDHGACNELATYEQLPNGSFAAKPGQHDDMLMTRALALYVMRQERALVTPIGFINQPSW